MVWVSFIREKAAKNSNKLQGRMIDFTKEERYVQKHEVNVLTKGEILL